MQINLCFQCMEETSASPCPRCGYVHRKSDNPEFALQPGTILHGKYLVGTVLGQGGFGITYIGLDIALNKKIAIKEYFPASCVFRDSTVSTFLEWNPTEEAQTAHQMGQELFLKEARKMIQVNAISQVVHVLDLFEDNHTAYIVMDYIAGESLANRITESGPITWQAVLELLLPVADVMQAVHEAGLIHRDLSPDNLMIQPNGTIKILDLGAAKDLHLHNGTTSMQVAKLGFSPIEQYIQTSHSGPWTDVYSLAATIYFSLTGVIPPSAVDRMGGASLRWDHPLLRKIPFSMIRVLQKGMALQGKDRYQSIRDFAEELRKAASSKKRKAMLIGSIAAAVIALILFAVPGYLHLTETDVTTVPTESLESNVPRRNNVPQESEPPVGVDEPWYNNVLAATVIPAQYEYSVDQAPVFNSRIARYQIVSVKFLDSLDTVGANSWDVSQNKDGSVVAWTEPNGTVNIWQNSKNVTSQAYTLYIAAEGGINGKYCAHLFDGFSNVKAIDFNNCFHTDNTKSMENMFNGCLYLTTLDVSGIKTDNVRNMYGMFSHCSINELDISHFNTSKVESMSHMFYDCSKLKTLDLRNFDTSHVYDMSNMFSMTSKLTDLNISSFDTSSVTTFSFMFYSSSMADLDLTHFDTSKVQDISYIFSGSKIKRLDVTGWDTSNITRMDRAFNDCDHLTTIRGITDWDTSNVEDYESFMEEGKLIDGQPWQNLFQ